MSTGPRRVDSTEFDLRSHLPGWAARLLGLPGNASFERLRGTVNASRAPREELRGLSPAELHEIAEGVRRPFLPGYARSADGTPDTRVPRKSRIPAHPPVTPRALALLDEAARRALGYAPYDEQLLAACALHVGFAVELDTGEGKTLAGSLAAALHALDGRRVHVLSVNDYLARRDAEWMAPLFSLLGIDVAWVGQASTAEDRRSAYLAPVVYAPVSEVGYDVLRDRQVFAPE